MNETIREKAIRFIVILLCAFAVSIGFQMHSNAKNVTFETKAVPVHLSQNDSDSPVLAVYRYMENKHLLILYEIDRMNNHFFHAIHTIELNTDAKALAPDKETKGIWVELDGKWHYYNEQLKIEDRSIQYKNHPFSSYTYRYDQAKQLLSVDIGRDTVEFSIEPFHKLTGIYPLTEDQQLLVAIYENELILLWNRNE